MTKNNNVILSAKDVVVEFDVRNRVLTAIRSVSLDLVEGEVLAIVGESGSGKSVLTKTFTGMLEENGRVASGSIDYRGQDLTKLKSHQDWAAIRGAKIIDGNSRMFVSMPGRMNKDGKEENVKKASNIMDAFCEHVVQKLFIEDIKQIKAQENSRKLKLEMRQFVALIRNEDYGFDLGKEIYLSEKDVYKNYVTRYV